MDQYTGLSLRGLIWDEDHLKKTAEFAFTGDGLGKFTADVDLKGYNLENMYMEVYAYYDKTKVEERLLDWHGNLNLVKVTFSEYLRNLSGHMDNRIIILSTKDDSTAKLDGLSEQLLGELEMSDFTNIMEHGCGYAVITSDSVQEASSEENLDYQMEANGHSISLSNGGWYSGYYSSIIIDGEECSRNERGINVCVYNISTGQVEDTLTYNDGVVMESVYRMER